MKYFRIKKANKINIITHGFIGIYGKYSIFTLKYLKYTIIINIALKA